MRILVISDHLNQGGAAIACNRLCQSLVSNPEVSLQRFFLNPCAEPGNTGFDYTPGTGRRLENLFELFSSRDTQRLAPLRRYIALKRLRATISAFRPDVINLHNVHGFDLPLRKLGQMFGSTPLVWTLHDMWSFTGRCAYAYDCSRFMSGCDAACPKPDEYPAFAPARISAAWNAKQAFLRKRPRTAAACPSSWLGAEARRGFWSNHPVATIPNGLPLDVFFPVEKRAARLALGLPTEGRFALMVADYLSERRKGGDMIGRALSLSACEDVNLITMGHSQGLTIPGLRVHPLGYIKDDTVKRLVYSAADLLIHPAPVDNLPNTVVEAQACGTPTAAFRTGGLPEMVIPGETGWLCNELSTEPFAKCLSQAFTHIQMNDHFAKACRTRATQLHSLRGMAEQYIALFKQTLERP